MIHQSRMIEPDDLKLVKEEFNVAWSIANEEGKITKFEFYKKNKQKFNYSTPEVKRLLKLMSNNRCSFCTRKFKNNDKKLKFTIEHIKPKSLNEDSIFAWDNLISCCERCNNLRGDERYDESLYLDPSLVKTLEEYFIFNYDGEILINEKKLNDGEIRACKAMIKMYNLDSNSSKKGKLTNDRKKFYDMLRNMKENNMCTKNLSEDSIIFLHLYLYNERRW